MAKDEPRESTTSDPGPANERFGADGVTSSWTPDGNIHHTIWSKDSDYRFSYDTTKDGVFIDGSDHIKKQS